MTDGTLTGTVDRSADGAPRRASARHRRLNAYAKRHAGARAENLRQQALVTLDAFGRRQPIVRRRAVPWTIAEHLAASLTVRASCGSDAGARYLAESMREDGYSRADAVDAGHAYATADVAALIGDHRRQGLPVCRQAARPYPLAAVGAIVRQEYADAV